MVHKLRDIITTNNTFQRWENFLQDENSKLRALISNNFGRRKNNPAKDRKVLETYVSFRGYKQGEIGRNHFQKDQNVTSEKSTLDEIAKELNIV